MGKRSVVKERFSKKYRHPILDSKLTLKRLNAVSITKEFPFFKFNSSFRQYVVHCVDC